MIVVHPKRNNQFCLMVILILLIVFSGLSDRSWAQAPPPRFQSSLTGSGTYQFNSNIDDGGDFSVQRYLLAFSSQRQINKNVRFGAAIRYDYEDWDFSEQSVFGASPWDTIHQLELGLNLGYASENQWFVQVLATIKSAGESDADFGDSLGYGGSIVAAYHISPRLSLGIIGTICSEIETVYARAFIFIDWRITDSLRLANSFRKGSPSPVGIELTYRRPSQSWELALGGATRTYRFRLDDKAPAPGGVGQVESFPIWIRTTYNFSQRMHADLYAGYVLAGNLRLENQSGNLIREADHDPALICALTINGRF